MLRNQGWWVYFILMNYLIISGISAAVTCYLSLMKNYSPEFWYHATNTRSRRCHHSPRGLNFIKCSNFLFFFLFSSTKMPEILTINISRISIAIVLLALWSIKPSHAISSKVSTASDTQLLTSSTLVWQPFESHDDRQLEYAVEGAKYTIHNQVTFTTQIISYLLC